MQLLQTVPLVCKALLLLLNVLHAGVGKMTWLLDFGGYTMRNAPAIRTSVTVLQTLQVGCMGQRQVEGNEAAGIGKLWHHSSSAAAVLLCLTDLWSSQRIEQ